MRRILVDEARRRLARKQGGAARQIPFLHRFFPNWTDPSLRLTHGSHSRSVFGRKLRGCQEKRNWLVETATREEFLCWEFSTYATALPFTVALNWMAEAKK